MRKIKNRRQETRFAQHGQRLNWRKIGPRHRRRKGWFHDISATGMSFLVEQNRQPQVGDPLQVSTTDTPANNATSYRVVRINPIEGNLALIGCQRDPLAGIERKPVILPSLDSQADPHTGRDRANRPALSLAA